MSARLPRLEAVARTVALLDVLRRLAADTTAMPITGPGYAPAPDTAVRDRIDAVCRYLQQAHTGPVEQTEAAAPAHVSPMSFSRFFRRAMGRTLTDCINQLRVETACSLLTATSLPVTEVAARSGNRNLSNVNRRFRELKGLPPTEYRAGEGRSGERVAASPYQYWAALRRLGHEPSYGGTGAAGQGRTGLPRAQGSRRAAQAPIPIVAGPNPQWKQSSFWTSPL